jgi:endopolyphosphatase
LFYKVHTSTQEGIACHRGNGVAGTYGAETSDCDSPPSLINATFDWIAANIKDKVDFVIWTGDSARHDSDEEIPRSPAQVLDTNRLMADKFFEVFGDPATNRMSVPVIPTLGNNDILPHNILLPGPNKWLQYYTDVWKHFIPEEQRHSFEFGGWFYVEVVPNKLAVFSLNTLYFFDRNAGIDDCIQPTEPGFKQMEWLRVQLQFMRERGMKAILMGHIPPAQTDSKQNWDESCWQKYTLWLQQYRDVVSGAIYGHMNLDHFFIHDTKDINIDLMSQGSSFNARRAIEDEMSSQSKADYLQELRDGWSKMPKPLIKASEEESLDFQAKKKKNKKKKDPFKDIGGKWAERYILSLISPSIVPNYFPTLRILEYNTSGLENAPVWEDASPKPHEPGYKYEDGVVDADLKKYIRQCMKKRKSGGGGGSQKGKKPKKPKDPNLIIPLPPSKSSLPGPAYSPQSLTLLGYTQYYANLTYINNDISDSEDVGNNTVSGNWRKGMHKDKVPKDDTPEPRPFKFEVEYDTFQDKIYKLDDMTVRSFVKLANRIGQDPSKSKSISADDVEDADDTEDGTAGQQESTSDSDSDSEDIETEKNKGKKKGDNNNKKKKSPKKKHNRVWLHFLSHAFVSTIGKKELKEL